VRGSGKAYGTATTQPQSPCHRTDFKQNTRRPTPRPPSAKAARAWGRAQVPAQASGPTLRAPHPAGAHGLAAQGVLPPDSVLPLCAPGSRPATWLPSGSGWVTTGPYTPASTAAAATATRVHGWRGRGREDGRSPSHLAPTATQTGHASAVPQLRAPEAHPLPLSRGAGLCSRVQAGI
jgi:hypothetical protein